MRKQLNERQKQRIQDEFCEYVGNNIKKYRIKKNIPQDELGHFVGKSKASISQYEKGKNHMPLSTLGLICYYCDIPPHELFLREKSYLLADIFDRLIQIDTESQSFITPQTHAVAVDSTDHSTFKNVRSSIQTDLSSTCEHPHSDNISDQRKHLNDQNQQHDALPFTRDSINDYLSGRKDLQDLLISSSFIMQRTSDKPDIILESQLAHFVIYEVLHSDPSQLQQKRLKEYYLSIAEQTPKKKNNYPDESL